MYGPATAAILADLGEQADARPRCKRCKVVVDVPAGLGTVFCSSDCLPAPKMVHDDVSGLLPMYRRSVR